eukprot:gene24715-29865_t
MTGTISDDISNLTRLRSLKIGENTFTGTLPLTIQGMANLSVLGFQLTRFDGGFPTWVCNMTWLTSLQFGGNDYNGTLPTEIGNLKNLLSLQFDSNLYSGPFPEVLFNLLHLEFLDMQFNLFTSTVPSSMAVFRNLSVLYIGGNLFEGSLPCASINQLTNISVFNARNMILNGTIDGCFEALNNITDVEIGDNIFSGNLPTFSKSLVVFIAYNNTFTGPLPTFRKSDRRALLRFCSIGLNYLNGPLPVDLVIAPEMSFLAVNNNFLNGSLHLVPTEHSNLAQIFLEDNLLTGSIPSVLANYSNLVEISLSGNFLTGTFPTVLNNLTYLAVLLIANNQLIGDLYSLYSPVRQPYVRDVDVSRNFFTGTIPGFLFHLSEMNSFSAFSNCLHGTLPDDICQATTLSAIVLDGVSTADRCRRRIFPGSSVLKAFVLYRSLGGTIPSCLFNLPNLHTLQLAGNEFTGSLPPNMTVNQQMVDLTLSHNSLTGSIPLPLQKKFFPNLDLSFNRFSGTLSDDFVGLLDGNTISLRVNRLSGSIPAAFKSKRHINVLEGNMFDCDATRSTLPTNDPSRDIYVCGSEELNYSVYAWCGVSGFLVLLLSSVLFTRYLPVRQPSSVMLKSLWNASTSLVSLPADILSSLPADHSVQLIRLFDFYAGLRAGFLVLSLVSIVIFLPTYGSLTQSSHTYEDQYGWSISGVFLQVYEKLYHSTVVALHKNQTSNQASNISGVRYSKYGVLMFVNLIAMACVDSTYIYIFLNFGGGVVAGAQISMAFLKIIWNELVLWNLLAFMNISIEGKYSFSAFWQLTDEYDYSVHDAKFVMVTTLLNNTIVPSIAIAFISSTCFYNAIIAAPVVKDSYYIFRCILYAVAASLSRPLCVDQQVVSLDVSYYPPFQYSYQCSSTIFVNYIPVFVFMFVGVAPNSIANLAVNAQVATAEVAPLPPAEEQLASPMHDEANPLSKRDKVCNPTADQLKNDVRDVSASSSPTSRPCSDAQANHLPILFQREKVVVQIVNYFAILLCFGTVYPPLAAIACVSFAVQSWASQYLVVSLLSRCWAVQQRGAGGAGGSEQDVVGFYADMLARQCRDVVSLFGSLVLFIAPFVAVLVGYLVFDTAGYAKGWREGLLFWVSFAICLLVSVFAVRPNCINSGTSGNVNKASGDPALSTSSQTAAQEDTIHHSPTIASGDEFGRAARATSRFSLASAQRSRSQPSLAGEMESKSLAYLNEL